MKLEDRVLLAKTDKAKADALIKEYQNFISSSARVAMGRYINSGDDEMSVAMLAFYEAINKFDPERGSFIGFAGMVLRKRLTDYKRREYKNENTVTFSSLSRTDEKGKIIEFEAAETPNDRLETQSELDQLSEELKEFNIDFFDIANACPKSQKTKKICFEVINFIVNNARIVNDIKVKKQLPIAHIQEGITVSRKILERHRKYLIAATVIITGDYLIVREYFKEIKVVST